jgi:hypothetical protein
MNKDLILFHLNEAEEQLRKTIKALRDDPAYEFGNYLVEMQHLYLHLNTAWNGRDATETQFAECSQPDFDAWRRFPTDLGSV